MASLNWPEIITVGVKILATAIVGAATGFGATGTWQGAASGALTALGGLFLKSPQSHTFRN